MRWLLFVPLLLLVVPFVSADLLRCDSEQYKGVLCEASEGVYKAYQNHLNEVKASKSNCGKQPRLPQPPGCEGGWVQYKCPFDEPARNLIFEIADICPATPETPTPAPTETPKTTPVPPTVTPPKPVVPVPPAERKHCCFCLVRKGMQRESLPIGIVYTPEQCQQSCQKYGFLNNLEIIKHIARVGFCPQLMPVSAPKEEIKEAPCKDCRSLQMLVNSKNAGFAAKSAKLQKQLGIIQRYIALLKKNIGFGGEGVALTENLYAKLGSAERMEAEVKRQLEEIQKKVDALADELFDCMNSPLPPCPGLGGDGLERPPTPGSPGGTVERPKFISEEPPECHDSDALSPWPPEVEGYVKVTKPGKDAEIFKDSCTVQTIKTMLGERPFSATLTEWFCKDKTAASMEITCNTAECNKKGTACGHSLTKAPPECGNLKVETGEQCDPPGAICLGSTSKYYLKGVCKPDCSKCEWTDKTPIPPEPPKPAEPKPPEPTEPKGPPPVIHWDDEDEEAVGECKDCRIFKTRLDSQNTKSRELSAQLSSIQKHIKKLEMDIALSGEVKAAVNNLYAQLEDAKRTEAKTKSQFEEVKRKIFAHASILSYCMSSPLPPCEGLDEDGLDPSRY
ncbi:hypothetical protein HY489_02715 [Candidatus Woesearchaeota archaeon]|nr:hypothetical protein [Candidatus Woesearchaeota archaeon]